MKPSLIALLIVLVIVVLAPFAADQYTRSIERTYIHALAPRHAPVNVIGTALQRIAFEQSDLLPIYGASEVLSQSSAYQPSQFFANYRTGFTTFEVAKGGVATIIVAQALGALGSDLQGKKVVISFTPGQFTSRMMGPDGYAGLFSNLHANELAFNMTLSFATKQMMAQRMLQYPRTLEKDPVLRFALENLADGSPVSQGLYFLVLPLGKLQTLVLELQDDYETITYIQSLKNLDPNIPHKPSEPDWKVLQVQAEREQIPHSNNNPFGFDNDYWTKTFQSGFQPRTAASGDKSYLDNLQKSAEWTDLEILLRILKEEGAQPLLLGRPFNAGYYDATGISESARQAFYAKMDQFAARYGVAVVDFRDYERVSYFGVDPAPHMARKGWVYVDQILDAFYHGTREAPGVSDHRADLVVSGDSDRSGSPVR